MHQVTQAVKDDFPQITIKDILALPFPQEKYITQREEEIIGLVDSLLFLNEQLKNTPYEMEKVKRDIDLIDQRLDYEIYGLYGLSNQAIKIVEIK